MPKSTTTIHGTVNAATRALRDIAGWAEGHQREKLRLAERILDEVGTYATLRCDPQVSSADAEARLSTFLDTLL